MKNKDCKFWTYEETKALISVYEYRQNELHKYKYKKPLFWQKCLDDLEKLQVLTTPTTALQVENKWKCLVRGYFRIRKSAEARFQFKDEMAKICKDYSIKRRRSEYDDPLSFEPTKSIKIWKTKDVKLLLKIIKETNFMERLSSAKKGGRLELYKELEKELKKYSVERTLNQIRFKLSKIKTQYIKFQVEKKINPFAVPPYPNDIMSLLRHIFIHEYVISTSEEDNNDDTSDYEIFQWNKSEDVFESNSRISVDSSIKLNNIKTKQNTYKNNEICINKLSDNSLALNKSTTEKDSSILNKSKAKQNTLKYEEICRICLKFGDDLLSLYVQLDPTSSKSRIIDYINECFRINMEDSDDLPQHICLECLGNIRRSYKFYKKMISTETELTSLSKNTKEFTADEDLCGVNNLIRDLEMELYSENSNSLDVESAENQIIKEIEREQCDDGNNNEGDVRDDDIDYDEDIGNGDTNSYEENGDDDGVNEYSDIDTLDQLESIEGSELDEFIEQEPQNPKSSDILMCPYCKTQSFSRIAYIRHFRKCKLRKTTKFQCEMCGALFKHLYTLKYHNQMDHGPKKQYPCQICNKVFSKPYQIKRHIKIHTNRQFKCELCEKTFISSYDLKIHIRKHENIRPHICKICSKGFMQTSHLRSHEESHNTERKYDCDLCNKSYCSRDVLKGHIKKSHPKKLYYCPFCNLKTVDSGWFRRHLLRSHNSSGENIKQYMRAVDNADDIN